MNTEGEVVYLVRATEDDFQNKQNAAISKVIRNFGLRLIPGDILDECRATIERIKADRAAKDPEAEKKRVLDAFAAIGVGADRLKQYLGHPLEELSPAELVDLRELYEAIRDGETTWAALMEERLGEAAGDAARSRPPRKSDRTAGSGETKPADPPPPGDGHVTELQGGSRIVHPSKQPSTDENARPCATKLTPATFSEIYKLQKIYNEEHGEGAAKAILVREFHGIDSPSKLSEDAGQRFVEIMRDGLR